MTLMKEMGVNFIRLGHYQQSDIILSLCDELGILYGKRFPGAAAVWVASSIRHKPNEC